MRTIRKSEEAGTAASCKAMETTEFSQDSAVRREAAARIVLRHRGKFVRAREPVERRSAGPVGAAAPADSRAH